MGVIKAGVSAFLLHKQPFERFQFSRWQSGFVITLLGILQQLARDMSAPSSEPTEPLWTISIAGALRIWLIFLCVHSTCRWWLQRDGRWDGQGDLFNLIAASWLVTIVLFCLLKGLGVPDILLIPVWVYSIWVSANAMSGAIPKASLGYSIVGIVYGNIFVSLLALGTMIGLGFIFLIFGPGPGGATPPAAG